MHNESGQYGNKGRVGCERFLRLLHLVSFRLLALLQGLYFLLGGLWPLISMSSFLAVTGPKADLWLVKTVSLLLMTIGLTLIIAWGSKRESIEIVLLAAGSAASLAAIDIIYAVKGRISSVYLLDAAVELFFVILWAHILLRRRRGNR